MQLGLLSFDLLWIYHGFKERRDALLQIANSFLLDLSKILDWISKSFQNQ